MAIAYHRPTKAIIHTEAIEKNVRQEVLRLGGEKELFAVVKADGYGHGAVEVAQAAKKGGATGFCVAVVDEGIQLREAGFTEPILVLGVVNIDSLELVTKYDLSITITSKDWLIQALNREPTETVTPLKLHIKVDTGMGRIGFMTTTEILEVVKLIEASDAGVWEGIFTHFATADEVDQSYWQQQVAAFTDMLDQLPRMPRYVHTSNSATVLFHEAAVGNMIRFGVAMYGLNPSGHQLSSPYVLEPAMELISELVHVKELPAGYGVSYGKTYTTQESEWIGTVPIGYADGWLRKMQGFSLLVEGTPCEIVGRVCMDQLMIRLPKEYKVGTKVTLVGTNGNQTISLQDVADWLETIHYEVACTFSQRIPREYRR